MSYTEFSENFARVCFDQLSKNEAIGFAFIFYEQKSHIQNIVNEDKGFQTLDELSGKDMTVFYLSNPDVTGDRFLEFNQEFSSALEIQEEIVVPSIVYFRVSGREIHDIDIKSLNNDLAFHLQKKVITSSISKKIDEWKKQGNFSALNAVPLLKFLKPLKAFAG